MSLPRGWTTIPLGEIADSALGKMLDQAKRVKGNSLPYLRNINVRWGTFELDDLREMPFEDHELERYGLLPGDVLVCEGGEPGRAAVWIGVERVVKFQKAIHRIRPGGSLQSHWIVYHLRHDALSGDLEEHFSGTTIKHFTGVALSRYPVRLPPVSEQVRIVTKLETLTAKSRRAKEALDAIPPLLERFRQSVLASAFRGDLTAEWRAKNPNVEPADKLLQRIRTERRRRWEESELAKMQAKGKTPGDDRWKQKYEEPKQPEQSKHPALPDGWLWSSIETVGDVHLGRQRAPQYLTGQGTRKYLRVANIKEDRIDFSDLNEMDFDEEEFEHYCLRSADILLSEGQSPELVGQSAIFRGEREGLCFQKTLHRFRRHESAPSAEFAQLVFRFYLRTEVFRLASSLTVNLAHLTLVRLKPLQFPVPPQGEQDEIVRILTPALRAIDAIELRTEQMTHASQRLNRSILAKAFRGELVPQDPTDEPASVLLDRIRGERAAAELTKARKPPRRPL